MGSPATNKAKRRDLASELGARSSIYGLADSAERLLGQLRAMDYRCFESMATDTAVHTMLVGPLPELTRALNEAMRLLRSLPAVVGVQGAQALTQELGELLAEVPAPNVTPAVEGLAQPPRDRYAEELDASLKPGGRTHAESGVHLMEVCARTVQVLRDALELLRQARREQSKWALITAGEEGRRKAQKGLRAAFILGMRMVAPQAAEQLFPNDVSELQTALQVRAALMEFRRDIETLLGQAAQLPDVEVGLLMRDARIRMLQLFADRAYHDVRAPDRFALQQLCSRTSDWLDKVWDNFAAARGLLGEVLAYALALDSVNEREILRAHDREAQAQALGHLTALAARPPQSLSEGQRSMGLALRDLQRMEWRSDALDRLVRAQQGTAAHAPDDVQKLATLLSTALAAVHIETPAAPAP